MLDNFICGHARTPTIPNGDGLMSIEKTKRDRHEYAAQQIEGLFGIKAPRSPAKYRKDVRCQSPDVGPDLICGMRCIVQKVKNGKVIGYLLGRVIDWSKHEGYWDHYTSIYYVVESASQEKLDVMVGRLMHDNYQDRKHSFGWRSAIVSFNAADMPSRKEAA